MKKHFNNFPPGEHEVTVHLSFPQADKDKGVACNIVVVLIDMTSNDFYEVGIRQGILERDHNLQ
jgi:signal transduction histidine kinase